MLTSRKIARTANLRHGKVIYDIENIQGIGITPPLNLPFERCDLRENQVLFLVFKYNICQRRKIIRLLPKF